VKCKDMVLKDKRVLVVGLARTGVSVAKFLRCKGAHVIITDLKPSNELTSFMDELRGLDIEFQLGGHEIDTFKRVDSIVVSPGVPLDIMPIKEAQKNSIEIMGEVELAYRFINTPIIAVTGTNGKTTTTAIISEMLKASGYKVYVGGNIGSPLIDYASSSQDKDYVVAEISSFQLDGIRTFRPKIGLLLNITEDHLDRYPGLLDYAQSKSRIFMNQTPEDVAILNKDDPLVMEIGKAVPGKRIYFSTRQELQEGTYIRGKYIVFKNGQGGEELFDITKLKIIGTHNHENVMSAILTTKLCKCAHESIVRTLEAFQGLEHRLEFVRTLNGVTFYNDSKGTNVGSVIKSLGSFTHPIILIAGGKDKGGDFSLLRELVKEKVKLLILLGEAKEKISRSLRDLVPDIMVHSLEEAVKVAYNLAKSGDIVLFSPACSSFDMFQDYKERGDVFKKAVRDL